MKNNFTEKLQETWLSISEFLLLAIASLSIAALIVVILSNSTFAQKAEVGVLLGASNYLGEIGGDSKAGQPFISDLQYNMTKLSTGAFYRYEASPAVAYRLNFIYGRIAGDDKYSSNYGRELRNLHFRSDIIELSLQTEAILLRRAFSVQTNPFKNGSKSPNHIVRGEVGLYAFGGVGVFHFNPQAKLNGDWIDLQPLGTEGQGITDAVSSGEISLGEEKYKLTQVNLPMGAGLFYRYGQYKVGFEIGWRMTFTDYLDDVSKKYIDPAIIEQYNGATAAELSNRADEITNNAQDLIYTTAGQQRGNPDNNDSYIFSMFSFSWILGGDADKDRK